MFILGCLLSVALLVGVDQLTKWWAVTQLAGTDGIPLWKDVFELTYVENRGAAFGMLQNQQWLFVAVTLVLLALVGVLLFGSKAYRHPLSVGAGVLIIAGGIGNLIDRLLNGFVVDFLNVSLIDFPVFNFADICVTVGAAVAVIYLIFFDGKMAKENENGTENDQLVMGSDDPTGQSAGGSVGCDPINDTEMDVGGSDND